MTTIDLTGKTAIVTGGGRGLGRAMTLALAEAGANVGAVMHIADDVGPLEAASADLAGKVRPILADIRDPEQCARAVAETTGTFGGPHVLVNNAGVGMLLISETYNTVPSKFWDATPDAWQQIIDTNFVGAFQMAREAVAPMLEQGWGRIINVTTSLTTMQRRGYSPYGPSKAALEATTSAWAGDLEGTGVTANVLIPGGAADTHLLPGEPGTPGRNGRRPPAHRPRCDAGAGGVGWRRTMPTASTAGGSSARTGTPICRPSAAARTPPPPPGSAPGRKTSCPEVHFRRVIPTPMSPSRLTRGPCRPPDELIEADILSRGAVRRRRVVAVADLGPRIKSEDDIAERHA